MQRPLAKDGAAKPAATVIATAISNGAHSRSLPDLDIVQPLLTCPVSADLMSSGNICTHIRSRVSRHLGPSRSLYRQNNAFFSRKEKLYLLMLKKELH